METVLCDVVTFDGTETDDDRLLYLLVANRYRTKDKLRETREFSAYLEIAQKKAKANQAVTQIPKGHEGTQYLKNQDCLNLNTPATTITEVTTTNIGRPKKGKDNHPEDNSKGQSRDIAAKIIADTRSGKTMERYLETYEKLSYPDDSNYSRKCKKYYTPKCLFSEWNSFVPNHGCRGYVE